MEVHQHHFFIFIQNLKTLFLDEHLNLFTDLIYLRQSVTNIFALGEETMV